MAKPTTAYIGLGGNLGDRRGSIRAALKMLTGTEGVEVVHVSDIIETTPLAQMNQPRYLNAVAQIETTLNAEVLYRKMADIETLLGRTRKGNGSTSSPSRAKSREWSPRVIDLDLILFGDELINHSDLTVPHPQMHLRSFVLTGLCQLNAALLHPVIKEPMKELAGRLNNTDFAPNPEMPQLVSVAGIIGVGKTTLTKKLSDLLSGKCVLEAYDANPFLPDVYAGRKELALDSQLFFLTSRIVQLNPDTLEQGQIAITDYIFDKELIYARRLLNAQQLALYEQIYPPLAARVVAPVLVIYLTDSVQNCLERIHRRNRPYEQQIKPQFLEALSSDYEQLFADWKTCPVIRLSVSKLDYMKDDNVDHLTNQIRSYIAV